MPASCRLGVLAAWLLGACTSTTMTVQQPPPSPAASDPTSGCQRALSHVVALSVKAVGEGPTNAQRGEVIRRCMALGSARGSDCVLRLKRLAGRRGGEVRLATVWGCLR
jgi:hypothetical protein